MGPRGQQQPRGRCDIAGPEGEVRRRRETGETRAAGRVEQDAWGFGVLLMVTATKRNSPYTEIPPERFCEISPTKYLACFADHGWKEEKCLGRLLLACEGLLEINPCDRWTIGEALDVLCPKGASVGLEPSSPSSDPIRLAEHCRSPPTIEPIAKRRRFSLLR